jgi:hypothetical protein
VDQKMYRSMIGSLLYVTASKPDVMFSVEYWDTWSTHKMLDYGILREQSLSWLDIQTLIMRDARLREGAHRAYVNYWEDHLFLGH